MVWLALAAEELAEPDLVPEDEAPEEAPDEAEASVAVFCTQVESVSGRSARSAGKRTTALVAATEPVGEPFSTCICENVVSSEKSIEDA